MLELYKKMYATVVGGADQAISDLAGIAAREVCDRQQVLLVAEALRQTLLKAEELYLDAEDEPE